MTPIDGFIIIMMLVMFAAVTALAYQRQNGMIERNKPEPTVMRQLQHCRDSLATAQQSVDVWRNLAEKQKAIIAELSAALENHDR